MRPSSPKAALPTRTLVPQIVLWLPKKLLQAGSYQLAATPPNRFTDRFPPMAKECGLALQGEPVIKLGCPKIISTVRLVHPWLQGCPRHSCQP